MNLTEVKKQLDRIFSAPPRQGGLRNIVFWYDEDASFQADIDDLSLNNAKIIKIDDKNLFATKLYIEHTDKTSNLLVYSAISRPDNKQNWLTDIIKYSQTFATDETSLHLLNFKIDNALRHVVERYKVFFRNNDRAKKFESYNLAPYSESKINLGVLSVLCKLNSPNIDYIVRALLIEWSKGETVLYDAICKFGDINVFWGMLEKTYSGDLTRQSGVVSKLYKEQSLEKLAISLFATHLRSCLNEKMPSEWNAYVSSSTNCVVFVDNFMKDVAHVQNYKRLAKVVGEKLGIEEKSKAFSMDDCADCDTFQEFDRNIILRICENINMGICEYEKYKAVITQRRNKRFYLDFKDEYRAIKIACSFFIAMEKHKDLAGTSAVSLYNNYVEKYCEIDRHYRKFIYTCDKLQHKQNGVNLAEFEAFGGIAEKIENAYTNNYLNNLSVKWSNLIDEEKIWQFPGLDAQQYFYDRKVRQYIDNNERIVVIISDGLRYESAVELNEYLTAEQKGVSKISSMVSTLPSCTKLGMAALLPHKNMGIDNGGVVTVDGMSTQGTENREKVLKTQMENAVAMTYKSVMDLAKNKAQLKEKFNGVKLIYIYHNAIDARGDHAGTEGEVFSATEQCFEEISLLIKTLKNNISAINFLVTADHGYIYKRTQIQKYDKTPKEFAGAIEGKRRYMLTSEKPSIQGTQCFSCRYLRGVDNVNVVVPRGTNCFMIQGEGSQYVHGGTSLQEVVVPVISFKSDKNSHVSMSARKVTLGLSSLTRKLTNNISHLNFFQNEKVEDKMLKRRVKAYFIDEKDVRISNENIIIADSTSSEPQARTYREKFTLKDMPYSKDKKYYLVLEDEEESVNSVIEKIPFVIDLVFNGVKF